MKVAIDSKILDDVKKYLVNSILPSIEVQQILKALSQTEPINIEETN